MEKYLKNLWGSKTNYYTESLNGGWKYVRYRIVRPLIKVKYRLFRKLHAPAPWLSPASILFFNDWLNGSQVGCEFGSGSSTLYFASRVKKVVSIEHNHEWMKIVKGKLEDMQLTDKVDYRFIPKGEASGRPGHLESLTSFNIKGFGYRKEFYEYIHAIADCDDDSFDFILVDGRARPECVFTTLPKLKSGGLLILDNSERERYEIVFQVLDSWDRVVTSNGLTDTTFWIKPTVDAVTSNSRQ